MDYEIRCVITGNSDDLRMHAIRNDDNMIVGWCFLHSSVKVNELSGKMNWDFNVVVDKGQ